MDEAVPLSVPSLAVALGGWVGSTVYCTCTERVLGQAHPHSGGCSDRLNTRLVVSAFLVANGRRPDTVQSYLNRKGSSPCATTQISLGSSLRHSAHRTRFRPRTCHDTNRDDTGFIDTYYLMPSVIHILISQQAMTRSLFDASFAVPSAILIALSAVLVSS